jgi:hypothetical protein
MFQTGFHRFKPICQVFLKLAAIRDQGRDDCIEIQGKTDRDIPMKLDAVPILAIFALAVLCVMVSIEGSYRLGRIVHQRSKQKSKRTCRFSRSPLRR